MKKLLTIYKNQTALASLIISLMLLENSGRYFGFSE